MNPEAIYDEVRALERLDLYGLRDEWRKRYGEPPKLRSRELLGLQLAWKIQADAFGGLTPEVKAKLRAPGKIKAGPQLMVGTRLTREWKGEPQVVLVTEAGLEWNGQTYKSLSAVARAITGIRWNGPRFFGLRDEAV